MDTLNSLISQLRELWTRTTPTGRVVAAAAVSTVVATVVGVAVWSSRPDYKLLREGISPVLTAEIVSALDANGIPNRMNYSGSGVLVPTSRWNEANIAISDLGIPDTNRGGTRDRGLVPGSESHDDVIRSKELALTKSLESLRAIKTADVHLAIPEPSPFLKNRQPASASVIVEPQPNQVLSRELEASIVHVVASAVEGLDPKNVTLTSSSGTLMGGGHSDDPAVKHQALIRDLEVSLVMKAQDVLAAALGPDKAVVRVTAQVDPFVDKVITTDKIEAGDKVTLTEKLETTDQKGMPVRTGGVAGTATNGGGANDDAAAGAMSEKKESTETTFDYPRTTETTRLVGGQPLRLSVSAAVDVTPDEENGGGAANATALLTQEQVEGMIQNAVGFDAARGDQIQVILTEFSDNAIVPTVSPVPDAQRWEFMADLAKNASLGMAAVVALLIGVLTLNKLKPIEIAASRDDERQRQLLSELSSRIDQNPEAVSKILASWLGNEASAEGESDANVVRKAA